MEDVEDILAALAYTDFSKVSRASPRSPGVGQRRHTVGLLPVAAAEADDGDSLGSSRAKSYKPSRFRDAIFENHKAEDMLEHAASDGAAQLTPESVEESREASFTGLVDEDEALMIEVLRENGAVPPKNTPSKGRRSIRITVPDEAEDENEEHVEEEEEEDQMSQRLVDSPLDNLQLILDAMSAHPDTSAGGKERRYKSTAEALEHAASGSHTFDSFQLNELTGGKPLSTLAMYLFEHSGVMVELGLDVMKTSNFCHSVEDLMRPENPYHNRMHITDVLQVMYGHISADSHGLAVLCTGQPLHTLAVLLAAIIHDLDHPGVNNDFLVKSKHPIALDFENEQCPLEHHHLKKALELLRQPENNFVDCLSKSEWELVWAMVREMVLNTDMKRHMPILEDMRQLEEINQAEQGNQGLREELVLVKVALHFSIAMKCSDLGHCVRPPHIHVKWSKAITSEFYHQGHKEAECGLPMTQGLFRPGNEVEIYQSQAWFLENLVLPLFKSWASISNSSYVEKMVDGLQQNIDHWHSRLSEGQRVEDMPTTPVASVLLHRRGSVSPSSDPNYASGSTSTWKRPTDFSSPRYTLPAGPSWDPPIPEDSDAETSSKPHASLESMRMLSSSLHSIPMDQYIDFAPRAGGPDRSSGSGSWGKESSIKSLLAASIQLENRMMHKQRRLPAHRWSFGRSSSMAKPKPPGEPASVQEGFPDTTTPATTPEGPSVRCTPTSSFNTNDLEALELIAPIPSPVSVTRAAGSFSGGTSDAPFAESPTVQRLKKEDLQ